MYRYSTETWFTFQEVIKELYGPVEPYDTTQLGTILKYINNSQGSPIWKNWVTGVLQDNYEELWTILFARFYDYYCVRVPYWYPDEEAEFDEDTGKKFIIRFINLLGMTYEKYSTLLNFYKAQETHLMDRIKSSNGGTTRFNDTPQNEIGSSDFSNDDHVSNITIVAGESDTEGMTPIMRLKEIQDHFKEVLDDWCNEFSVLFIPEEDITI